MTIGMYVVAPQPDTAAFFIKSSHESVSNVYPLIVSRELLNKKLPWQQMHMQKYVELLDALFSISSVVIRKLLGDHFILELPVIIV